MRILMSLKVHTIRGLKLCTLRFLKVRTLNSPNNQVIIKGNTYMYVKLTPKYIAEFRAT